MSASISKIHVTSSTGLSLNDRFTAIASQPAEVRGRSRSISRGRVPAHNVVKVEAPASLANRRLLQQLARNHKIQAALKLKRRSMRTAGASMAQRRGSLRATRMAANGAPIRATSLTKVATMRAEYLAHAQAGAGRRTSRPPLRRSNSIASRIGGGRRPLNVGGAAERVAKRRMLQRGRTPIPAAGANPAVRRGRSRSRSRARDLHPGTAISNGNRNLRGGSLGRGRVRSRSRGRNAGARTALPVKARLGVRPGVGRGANANENGGRPRRVVTGGGRRAASVARRGVQQGRVQKRSAAPAQRAVNGAGGRVIRARARSVTRNVAVGAVRSRSRSRAGARGGLQRQQQAQQLKSGTVAAGATGRSRSRRTQQRFARNGVAAGRVAGGGRPAPRNGKANGQQQQQQMQQQQPRRGRSRSRGGRKAGRGAGGARGGGGRNLGKPGRSSGSNVNRDELDKELDQYMATTKTENDMDYLLKN